MARRDEFIQIAETVPFDNTTPGATGMISTDVQAALDELNSKIQTSASPGFSFGRTGICNAGTYMQCETVPSNISGRWVYINSAKVTTVFVSNELVTTFTI